MGVETRHYLLADVRYAARPAEHADLVVAALIRMSDSEHIATLFIQLAKIPIVPF
jgi:hypothetical protein